MVAFSVVSANADAFGQAQKFVSLCHLQLVCIEKYNMEPLNMSYSIEIHVRSWDFKLLLKPWTGGQEGFFTLKDQSCQVCEKLKSNTLP